MFERRRRWAAPRAPRSPTHFSPDRGRLSCDRAAAGIYDLRRPGQPPPPPGLAREESRFHPAVVFAPRRGTDRRFVVVGLIRMTSRKNGILKLKVSVATRSPIPGKSDEKPVACAHAHTEDTEHKER